MVAAPSNNLHLVGDEDSSKRRQILDGARKVFLDLGFDGASMGEIARAAGVSKGTLYVYFADKNRLFEAIVEEETLAQGKVAFNFEPGRDVTTTLMEFGQAYIQMLCRPGGGSATRTVMAIAERMPEVGRRFYNNVIAHTIARLAAYLDAHVATGELVVEDRQLAVERVAEDLQPR
jgi:AcrR family transcriptional regulator